MDDWLSRTRERLENGSIDLEYALAGVEALEAAGVDTTGWRLEAPEPRRSIVDDGRARDLVAVLPGPPEYRAGHRVLVFVCFTDAVVCIVDRDEETAPDIDDALWHLTDDVGTDYQLSAFGGGSDQHTTWFSTPPPADAGWLEVSLVGAPEATFRVAL